MWKSNKTKKGKTSSTIGDVNNITIVFNSLADEDDPEIISMEGIAKIAEELKIDASSDVRILVLLWKLGSKAKPGEISRNEFVSGMQSIQKYSFADLREYLPSLDPGFLEKDEFRGDLLMHLLYIDPLNIFKFLTYHGGRLLSFCFSIFKRGNSENFR